MSRSQRQLARSTVRALAPVAIPFVTKVVLPIAIESLRRRKFDTNEFFEEATQSLGKGLKKSRAELDEVKEEVIERGQKLYDEARKQGAELIESLASKGTALAEEWMENVRPRRRRRGRLVYGLGIAAVVGVGLFLISRD